MSDQTQSTHQPINQLTPSIDPGETIWGAIYGGLVGLALAGAGLAIGAGTFGLAGETTSFWYLSRSAGFVAYLLLWGSVAWGLLLSTKIGRGKLKAPVLLDAHQFLSAVGLGFTFFHGLVLMGDQYLSFPLSAVLVPFAGSYEPLLVAAGQIGLWLSALLIGSFYVRKWISQRVWRAFHYTGFVAYVIALVHAILLGSDSGQLWVEALYLVTGGSVLFLTYYRILTAGKAERAQRGQNAPVGVQ